VPTDKNLIIKNPGNGYIADVYDIQGRQVLSTPIVNNTSVLDVSQLMPGLYILELTNTNSGLPAYNRHFIVMH
jgi:hypothetical protein